VDGADGRQALSVPAFRAAVEPEGPRLTASPGDNARRDTTGTGYGIAVFDLDPGEPGNRTTITVRYYHAPGADKTPTATYELFETIVLAKRRRD
jgi:hypothetical protein